MTFQEQVDLLAGMSVGTIRFIAANGDSVFAVFVGQGAPTADPNVLSLVEVATITGGTGRRDGDLHARTPVGPDYGHFLRLVYRDHIPSRETLTD
jgi:hypothetical protein